VKEALKTTNQTLRTGADKFQRREPEYIRFHHEFESAERKHGAVPCTARSNCRDAAPPTQVDRGA